MSVWADISYAFKWPLSELKKIPFDEVKEWHRLAVERLNNFGR